MESVQKGKIITAVICGYSILKSVINLFLSSDHATNIVVLILYIILSLLLLLPGRVLPAIKGAFTYSNYITAAVMGIFVIRHISYNFENLPSTWFYLLEAFLDIVCIIILCAIKDVKEFLKTK